MPCVPDQIRSRTFELGYSLIGTDGRLKGHDEHPDDGTTSWSLAQVLLGIARAPGLRYVESPRFHNALMRLLKLQNRTTGAWPLREGDIDDVSFAFYPVLLFDRLVRRGSSHARHVMEPLRATARHLLDTASGIAPTNMVLAVSALDRIARLGELSKSQRVQYLAYKTRLNSCLVDDDGGLRLEDLTLHNELQPRWHSVTWSPLLYGCTRAWGGVQSGHNLQIADRLISSFDEKEGGWLGPSRSVGKASSWASSLGVLNTYLLARDLVAAKISAEEFLELTQSEHSRRRFDIVISFGGPDRAVAQEVRDRLVTAGLRVFFDFDFRHNLLGEDLAVTLQDIYFRRSRYAVAILSRSFLKSKWAGNWEWRAVLARMNSQQQGYLLPYFLENVEVPGLNPTIGFLSSDHVSPREFAEIVVQKVTGAFDAQFR
ncbi:toll/interleukin-1 receptor domain-containing protein [Glycomyces sambucus]|uniref:toll/interleukin-1 receptor domain-containing protein n=1 Tax=Glycomyces sambucus TaxID=380244 RepID=UPI0015A1FD47|nr:toll/interleukin-1 receptor domain-containing protein [Glycomyces sambucus]